MFIVRSLVWLGLIVACSFVFCVPESKGYPVKTITLYSYNSIALRGSIDGDNASRFINQLARNTENTVIVYIDSSGGSVGAGMNIIDAIKSSGKRVICIANTAMSMSFSIFQSCTVRLVTPHAMLMQHQGALRVSGDTNKAISEFQVMLKTFDECDRMDAEKLKMPLRVFQNKIKDDWWLFGPEIVDSGAADAIVQVRCSKELSDTNDIIANSFVFSIVKIVYSSCPLVSEPLSVNIVGKEGSNPSDVKRELGDILGRLKSRQTPYSSTTFPKTH